MMLRYLRHLFDEGSKYNHLCSVRSVLNKHVIRDGRDESRIKQFMRGIFNLRPPVSKYMAIWDPSVVLRFISTYPVSSFMHMSKKLCTLFMILAGTRVNSISHMKISFMYLNDTEVTFVFDENLKHSRPGVVTTPLTFRSYPACESLCPVHSLKKYLDMRPKVECLHLFVTTTKPHNRASPDTIARWIKNMLGESGINSGLYTAHSCRSASTSYAKHMAGVGLATILKSAAWSGDSTFKRHYLREISNSYPNGQCMTNSYSTQILNSLGV